MTTTDMGTEVGQATGVTSAKLILRIIGGIAAFLVGVGLVFGVVAILGLARAVTEEPAARAVADLVLGLVVSGLVLFYAQRWGGVPRRAFAFTWDSRGVLLALAAGAATLALAAIYIYWLGQSGAHPLTIVTPPLGLLIIGFLGEFGVLHEEVLSRGYFLPLLQQRVGMGWALVIGALLFSLTHIFFKGVNFMLVTQFLAGLAFGYLYIKSGSLWTAVVVHACHNFATDLFVTGNDSGVSLGIAVFHFAERLSMFERWGFDILLTLMIVGLTYLCFGRGARFLAPHPRLRQRWATLPTASNATVPPADAQASVTGGMR